MANYSILNPNLGDKRSELIMGKTVSMSVGRVAIFHDIRKEISANVDHSLTKIM